VNNLKKTLQICRIIQREQTVVQQVIKIKKSHGKNDGTQLSDILERQLDIHAAIYSAFALSLSLICSDKG
jgi:hypothetical protein